MMGDSISQGGAMLRMGSMTDFPLDLDLMNDFLLGGCWLDSSNGYDHFQRGNPTSALDSSCFSLTEINNCSSTKNLPQTIEQDDQERSVLLDNQPPDEAQTQSLIGSRPLGQNSFKTAENSGQLEFYPASGGWNFNEYGKMSSSIEPSQRCRIEPREYPCPASSVKERFAQAVKNIKESTEEIDVLVQIWVPIKKGGRYVLTTLDQPFSLDPSCGRLVNYRTISVNYNFSAEVDSNEVVGLPGRVFLGRLPEWTPDVQYFRSDEYPRVDHAQQNDVRSTVALPVFEQGNPVCLGVVEVVRTTRKINYRLELESISSVLQAVNLRSSDFGSVPHLMVSNNNSYQVALLEIIEVLRAVCETHRLPLAQTWVPCIWQGKKGSRHSSENYTNCVSTADIACYVTDPCIWGFHEACSEHHLLRGQGVAGKAFTTNQPCFSPDITAFSRSEYPLSHYARIFGLRAAVAIRLRCIYTGNADYVLEFFLPIHCQDNEEQKLMLNSLSMIVQQVSQSLRVVTDRELEIELVPPGGVIRSFAGDEERPNQEKIPTAGTKHNSVSAQMKGKASGLYPTIPLECQKEIKEFSARTHCDFPEGSTSTSGIFPELNQHHRDSIKSSVSCGGSSFIEQSVSDVVKVCKKRSTKIEKKISLQVLQQHFSKSLNDAAKSIGVCPTTLKRICRQYGIPRWPSRTIQKVGHSLERLKVVIDSVQGVERAFQLSSLYPDFPHACSSGFTSPKMSKTSTLSKPQQITGRPTSSNLHPEGVFSINSTPSKSPSSSCSHSSSSGLCYSTGEQQCHASQLVVSEDTSMAEIEGGVIKQAYCEAKLYASTKAEQKSTACSLTQISHSEHPSLQRISHFPSDRSSLKVKVMNGDDNIRLNMKPSWGFQDLQQEVAKRFNIDDAHTFVLKYLDDESERVLLTCDDDLHECKDIYKSLCGHVIKLSVHHVAQSRT
ncbi:hypothetical protein AAC387_Pa07g1113 [Persea americana]